VWKLDVLGVGYDLESLGFVGTPRIWAVSLLCSEGEEFVKFFLWFSSIVVVITGRRKCNRIFRLHVFHVSASCGKKHQSDAGPSCTRGKLLTLYVSQLGILPQSPDLCCTHPFNLLYIIPFLYSHSWLMPPCRGNMTTSGPVPFLTSSTMPIFVF